MATAYEAVVQLEPVDAGPQRVQALVDLIQQNLPAQAQVRTDRDVRGQLLLSVTLAIVAADSSEVQLEARDVVVAALERAGLTEQAALLDDVNVRTSS
jgi:hypothetical protein